MKGRELFRVITRLGYSVDRQTGSHRRMVHDSRRLSRSRSMVTTFRQAW